MLKHQDGFDQTGQAGGCFQVAEVGFHRPYRQRNTVRTIRAQGVRQRVCLDRISHGRPCSVRFHKPDLRGGDPRVFAGLPHEARLRLDAWERNPVGMPILINCRPDDHCVDRVTLLDGLGKTLEDHDPRSFTPDKTVGRRVERFATAVRRKHRSLRKSDEAALRDHHGHGARESRVTVPRPNMFTSNMHRRQGRGTGGIQRNAWSAQVKAVRDAVCRDTMRRAGRRVGGNSRTVPRRSLNHLIVVVRNSGEYREVGSTFQVEHHARVLDRLPGCLQKKPVLGIHVGRFARRNSKKLRIELVDSAYKSPAARDRFAGNTGLGIVITLQIPAIGRDLADCLAAVHEKFPK